MADAYKTGELEPGMLIGGGKFALLRRIGEGGMGEVFEAEDTFIGRRVALKVLYPHLADNPDMARRFRREARAAASIVHPHIVTVYEFGQRSNRSFYIVQELLVGRNLRALLDERRTLDVTAALDILVPIMVALAAMHGRDIIHRDIKPENIFLTSAENGEVVPKLIDFGISKMDTGSLPLTRPGERLGTPLYMSPELILGEHVDGRTDVWAIGAVLFEALAGRSPFWAETTNQVLANVVSDPVPRLDAMAPRLPRELVEIVHRALERSFDRRYPSMQEFLRAVVAFAERHDPAFVTRHAGLTATVGLKSVPPPPESTPDGRVTIGPRDSSADETLDFVVQPSQRRPIWPLAPADASGERSRAPGLDEHVHDAQQALRLNALHEAIDRAEQAIVRYRAEGRTRGDMRLVQAIAFRWLGDFVEAERRAAEAMALLGRGTSGWFAAAAHRGMAAGYQGKNEQVEALTKDVLSLDVREWNGDHVATLCHLTIALVRGGAIDLAQRTFARARAMNKQQTVVEPAVHAAIHLAKAELALHGGDPTAYLRRVELAINQFALIGDARNVCLQRANVGNAYMQLGAYTQAEKLLREAITVGEPMKLMFITPVRSNLGFTLARLGHLDEAREVERAALRECIQQGYRRFEAVSRIYLTEILSLRGELDEAEKEARTAIEIASISPVVSAHARARLAAILLDRGQVWDAFDQAKKAMDTLELLDGVEEGEALIRLVYVMALDATGRPRSAHERLAGARQRLLDRVERITDPELRKSFTDDIPEHALTFEYTPRGQATPPPPPV